jgi:hypothetical protein
VAQRIRFDHSTTQEEEAADSLSHSVPPCLCERFDLDKRERGAAPGTEQSDPNVRNVLARSRKLSAMSKIGARLQSDETPRSAGTERSDRS